MRAPSHRFATLQSVFYVQRRLTLKTSARPLPGVGKPLPTGTTMADDRADLFRPELNYAPALGRAEARACHARKCISASGIGTPTKVEKSIVVSRMMSAIV